MKRKIRGKDQDELDRYDNYCGIHDHSNHHGV